MNVIAAIDENYAIGYKNNLLTRLPLDMQRFKKITSGNVVVMGKNTYFSLPRRPLPDRDTIVITSHPEEIPEKHENLRIVSSLEELLLTVNGLEENGREIYICGGSRVYRELLPYCEKALITKISASFEADSWFPKIDDLHGWEIINETEIFETNGYNIKFIDYTNKNI